VKTPWGDSDHLRERRMPPGATATRALRERNQRERLFAALVATVAAKGYEATAVADLVELSGVSRSSFYGLFDGKRDCLLGAVDTLTGPRLEALLADPEETVGTPEGARRSFEALIGVIADQPAAARLCLVEIYAAGEAGMTTLDRILDGLVALAGAMLERVPGREGMPPELVRGLVGGVQKAVTKSLLRGEAAVLPELAPALWEWLLCVPPPPGRLQTSGRSTPTRLRPNRHRAAFNSPERVLRALAAVVAEKGYPEAKVAEIAERARTSQRTFYESFADKESAMVAALDSGSAQMLALALPAFRRAADWPSAVYATQEAMLRFAAEEPDYGRLGAVEVYTAGERALEQRETVTESMEALLAVGFELKPEAPTLAPEAIGGALYALLYDRVRREGVEGLPELLPATTYITLAPFLGAEGAYAAAVV
jgi:AcrR family transcriptional regulator